VARQQSTWLAPLRTMMDGLEHRWNKWILEYDLDTQVNLFRRATETFARRDSTGELRMNPGIVQAFKWLMAAAGAFFILLLIFQRARFQDVAPESRVYLKLRRAYEKAGYDDRAHDGPLLFLDRLSRADAPGRDEARRAIELYVRSRFGGEDIGQGGKQELREAARAAQRSLRSARNRRADPSSSETSVTSRARAS
jgi:protein-glutamine gamma-glutamyltransferase